MRTKLLVLIAFISVAASAQPKYTFLNPGISLGYVFGNGGGVVFGFEVSATEWLNERLFVGIALKYDMWGESSSKFHSVAEVGMPWLAISFGPSWTSINSDKFVGYTGTVWTGGGILPYYAHTWYSGRENVSEVGAYLKIPLQVGGEKIGWSN